MDREVDTVRGVQQHGIRFPDGLWAEIERSAKAHGLPAAEWVRGACRYVLLLEKGQPPTRPADLKDPDDQGG